MSSVRSKQEVRRVRLSLVLKIACEAGPRLLREIHTEEPTKFLVFFPDGQHMMQVSLDGAIQMQISDGQRVGSFMAMPDVNACAISRDGRWFVAGHGDQVTIWDVTTRNKVCEHSRSQDLRVSSGRRKPYFTALDISPSSSRAAIGDSMGLIILLSIPTGEQLAVCSCDRDLYIDSLQLSPAGDYLAVGTAVKITDGHVTTSSTLHIWDVSSDDQLTWRLEVPFGSFDKEVGQDERPVVVSWLGGGREVLVGSHRSLVVIDVLSKSIERKDIPSFQTLSNDGKFILSTATPRKSSLGTYFWNPMTFTEVGFDIPRHLPLAVSSDSALLATFPLNDDSDGSNLIFIWTMW